MASDTVSQAVSFFSRSTSAGTAPVVQPRSHSGWMMLLPLLPLLARSFLFFPPSWSCLLLHTTRLLRGRHERLSTRKDRATTCPRCRACPGTSRPPENSPQWKERPPSLVAPAQSGLVQADSVVPAACRWDPCNGDANLSISFLSSSLSYFGCSCARSHKTAARPSRRARPKKRTSVARRAQKHGASLPGWPRPSQSLLPLLPLSRLDLTSAPSFPHLTTLPGPAAPALSSFPWPGNAFPFLSLLPLSPPSLVPSLSFHSLSPS